MALMFRGSPATSSRTVTTHGRTHAERALNALDAQRTGHVHPRSCAGEGRGDRRSRARPGREQVQSFAVEFDAERHAMPAAGRSLHPRRPDGHDDQPAEQSVCCGSTRRMAT